MGESKSHGRGGGKGVKKGKVEKEKRGKKFHIVGCSNHRIKFEIF